VRMKGKKFIGICLLLLVMNILVSCFIPINTYAETKSNTNSLNPHDYYTQPENYQPEVENKYKGQSPLERMIAGLFTSLATGIYEILGIKDPLMLIFDYEPMFDLKDDHVSREDLYLGIYDQSEMSVITAMYKTFEAYLPLLLFVAIVLTGLLMVFAGFGGDPRLTAKQYISGILLTCVLLLFGPNLIDIVFDFVYSGVDIIKDLIERTAAKRGIEIPQSLLAVLLAGFMRGDSNAAGFISDFSLVTGLMYAIIIFLIFIGAGVLNWQYIVREITLAVLIFMFPIVAGMAVFPNTRGALKMWFSEFFANAFLIMAHAVVYGFLIMISMSPTRSFSPLEIIIFIVGLNGTVGIVRGMFGAHQGKSGALGGVGTILGLSSLVGLGRMAFGMKGSVGGLFAGKTAREAVGQVVGAGQAAGTSKDIDKIAGIGNDLTPSQLDLMFGQKNNNLTDEHEMELRGPQKDLSIDNQLQNTADKEKAGLGLGKAVVFGTAGALIGGMVTGNASAGFAPGVLLGGKLTGGAVNTAQNIKKAVTNPNSMGIYNAGQLFDSKSAIQIGRNIAGAPGALVGWAANKAVHPFKIGRFEAKNSATEFADGVRANINNEYMSAQQAYLKSQQEMQLAQNKLQKIEDDFPETEKGTDNRYQRLKNNAVIDLAESKKEFHKNQILLKEAEMRKQHEHDYVGIQMQMESIRRPKINSSGGIS